MLAISLFTGIGGDTLAAEWAGFKTIQFVEKDPFCQCILNKHWPNTPIWSDIDDFEAKQYRGAIKLVYGGDPCQPNSIAGQRRGSEDDRYKWPAMLRVIKESRPVWVVNENPTGRLTMDFHQVLSDLDDAGYVARAVVIPACAVNAPHRRDRVYIIAYSSITNTDSGRKQQPEGIIQDIGRRSDNGNEPSFADSSSRESGKPTEQEGRQDTGRGDIASADTTEFRCNSGEYRLSRGKVEKDRKYSSEVKQNRERQVSWIGKENTITSDSEEPGLERSEPAREICDRRRTPEYYPVSGWQENWIEVATAFCGMDDGLPDRVARLRALGNAQVPQQIYPVFKAIAEIEIQQMR